MKLVIRTLMGGVKQSIVNSHIFDGHVVIITHKKNYYSTYRIFCLVHKYINIERWSSGM